MEKQTTNWQRVIVTGIIIVILSVLIHFLLWYLYDFYPEKKSEEEMRRFEIEQFTRLQERYFSLVNQMQKEAKE